MKTIQIAKQMKKSLKAGDVVSINGVAKWSEFHLRLAYWGIRAHQESLFLDPFLRPDANWQETHTTQYFPGRGMGIFTVEPPKAKWVDPVKYIAARLDEGSEVTILRHYVRRKPIFMNARAIRLMLKSAKMIVGTKYDYGQLLDIAINRVMGYGFVLRRSVFDLGRERKVCSVGVRVNFEFARRELETGPASQRMKRLFSKLNPEYWSAEEMAKFTRTDIEATCPAMFQNSRYFENEFVEIARVRL